jgi:hypothetical protein
VNTPARLSYVGMAIGAVVIPLVVTGAATVLAALVLER